MNNPKKYMFLVIFLSLLSISMIFGLFSKYSLEVLVHLHEKCQRLASLIWPLNVHVVGLGVLALVILSSIAFTAKTIFSFFKTKSKIKKLTSQKLNKLPNKVLYSMAASNHLDSIIVIKSNELIAFSYGMRKTKILISTRLIDSLNTNELDSVILHELHHLKYSHVLFIFIMEIVKSALFFVPLLSVFIRQFKDSLENEADKTVVKIQRTSSYLESAINVFSNNQLAYDFVASFSMRKLKSNRRGSVKAFVSTIIIFSIFGLFSIYPSSTHAGEVLSVKESSVCFLYQCNSNSHCNSYLVPSVNNNPDNYSSVSLVSIK